MSNLIIFIMICELMFYNTFAQNETEDYIQEAVKSLLGVKDGLEIPGTSNRRTLEPPKYMLDLYDTYNKGENPSQGNTVRSILPMQGKFEGFDMLIFNLTGVNSEEEILQGWLHIFRRRQTRGHRRKDIASYRLKVLDLEFLPETNYINILPSKKAGWFSYNVTNSVIKCRTVKKNTDYLLGITAEMKRSNGRYKTVSLRRIIRLNSQPFLIIFSEDRNRSIVKETDESAISTGYVNTSILSFRNQEHASLSINNSNIRSKRSINDVFFKKTPNSLNKMKETLQSNDVIYDVNKKNHRSENDQVTIKFSKKIDPNLISLPHNSELKDIRRPKNRRKFRKLPFWWLKYEGKHKAHNIQQLCRKKKLLVDFESIGWNEWIMSPISYDASYCSGRCTFPLIKNGNPTNHAIVQSLVHSWTGKSSIPAPCCVPSSMSSLTLLYIDENSNVILKRYPNMIVKSCACQ